MKYRTNHDAGFKARVALEAVKGERRVSELAADGVREEQSSRVSCGSNGVVTT